MMHCRTFHWRASAIAKALVYQFFVFTRVVSIRRQLLEHSRSLRKPAARGPLSRFKHSCCCKPGPCRDGALGARGHPAVYNADHDICCKEVSSGLHTSCKFPKSFRYHLPQDVSFCMPDEKLGNPVVRVCRDVGLTNHQFVQFADDGCAGLLGPDGNFQSVAQRMQYSDLDCPFAEEGVTNQARRALLHGFHIAKPASYNDIIFSCSTPLASLRVNTSGDRWKFLKSEEALDSFIRGFGDRDYLLQDFICGSLRLLPLMWGRIGFTENGITEDPPPKMNYSRYPRSFRGIAKKDREQWTFSCHHYTDFSAGQSRKGRRVLRAMLATYGVHTFVTDGTWQPGISMALGIQAAIPFRVQLETACMTESDNAYVSLPMSDLQESKAMIRDEAKCDKTMPCRYQDSGCKSKGSQAAKAGQICSCTCHQGICAFFATDFAATMLATDELCVQPKFFVGSAGDQRVNGAWTSAGSRNGRPLYMRVGDKHVIMEYSAKSNEWRMLIDNLMGKFRKTLYKSSTSSQSFPMTGWSIASGQAPAPKLQEARTS